MREVWRDIAGAVEQVSSLGQVRRGDVILEFGYAGKMKYQTVHINSKRRYVHQLVAEAFRGPRPKGKEVRHRDGKKYNNRATNLVWGTRQQNMADAVEHGTHVSLRAKGETNPYAKITAQDVIEIRRLRATTKLTCRQIGFKFGLARDTIQTIVSGKRWGHIREGLRG